jgi:hypothetical protein
MLAFVTDSHATTTPTVAYPSKIVCNLVGLDGA